jgi:hypothetical protein
MGAVLTCFTAADARLGETVGAPLLGGGGRGGRVVLAELRASVATFCALLSGATGSTLLDARGRALTGDDTPCLSKSAVESDARRAASPLSDADLGAPLPSLVPAGRTVGPGESVVSCRRARSGSTPTLGRILITVGWKARGSNGLAGGADDACCSVSVWLLLCLG